MRERVGAWVVRVVGVLMAGLAVACVVRSRGAPQVYRYQWAADDRCWAQAEWQIKARGDDEGPMRYATPDGERQARAEYDGCVKGEPLDNAVVTDSNVARRLCSQVADHLARLGQQRFRGDGEERIQECIRGQITEAKAMCILRARALGEIYCDSDGDLRDPARSQPARVAIAPTRPNGDDVQQGIPVAAAPARPSSGGITGPVIGAGVGAAKEDQWRPSPKYTPKPDGTPNELVTKPTDARADAKARTEGRRDLIRLKRECDAGDADACTSYLDALQEDPAFKAERDGRYLVGSIAASMSGCVSVDSGRLAVDQSCVDETRAASCTEVRGA